MDHPSSARRSWLAASVSAAAIGAALLATASPTHAATSNIDSIEKQIRALQGELHKVKAEMARKEAAERAEAKRHGPGVYGRDASGNPVYLGPGRGMAYNAPAAGAPYVNVDGSPHATWQNLGSHLAGDGRPPSDRADVLSWHDYQHATKDDEEASFGGMKIGFPNGRPTMQSSDGAYSFSVGLAFHEDFGGFINSSPRAGEARGTFNSFTTNARRLRIPFTFRYKNWVAAVTPDFGANHNDGYAALYEANLNYTGFKNTVLTVGYFQPRVTEEDSESSNDFFTLERPSITDAVRNIAAGDARFSVGGLHYEKRWWIGGYFTGQEWGHRNYSDNGSSYYGGGGGPNTTSSQTGGTFRLAGRPIATKDVDLHVGVSAIAAFRLNCVATDSTGNHCTRSASFGQRPEFDIGEANLVSAAVPNATQEWAAGPELGLRWNRLLLKGEYYHIGVERDSHPSAGFQGWYAAAAYTIFGKPRAYNIKEGAWGAPGVGADREFDPAHGHWGALEIVGHYSVIDLNSDLDSLTNAIRGGQQTVWMGGFNWYPNRHFRLMLDYDHFITSRSTQQTNLFGRSGDAIATRIQAAF